MSNSRRPLRLNLRLGELLQEQNKSVRKLSRESGVPPGTIGDLLTGRTAMPSADHLVALSDALGTKTLIVVEPEGLAA